MKVGNLEVTLKNIHTFEGHEGVGMNADVYVNGVKTFHYLDDANGGGGWPNGVFNRELMDVLDAEIEKMPPTPYDFGGDFKGEAKFDYDTMVNTIHEEVEKAKFFKKRTKLCETAIVWGKPDADGYHYINFKRDLNTIPKAQIEKYIKDKIVLEEGEIIFNTNIDIEKPVPILR